MLGEDPLDPGIDAEAPPEETGSSEHDPPVIEPPDPPNTEPSTPRSRKPRQPRKPRVLKPAPIEPTPAPQSLDEVIREALAGPKSVTVDGQNVTAHDLKQLLDADRYLEAKKAAGKPRIGFAKMVPPGAV